MFLDIASVFQLIDTQLEFAVVAVVGLGASQEDDVAVHIDSCCDDVVQPVNALDVLVVSIGTEDLLDLFQRFAFGLRQEEVDEDGAQQGAPRVEEERPVFAHGLQHVWEEEDGHKGAKQVEGGADGSQ